MTIEDSRDLQLFYEKIFSLWGHETYGAMTLAEAKRRLDDGLQPDLILLDLTLPDGNAETLKAELASGIFADLPFVLTSGRDDLQTWGRALGARKAFMKPVDLPQLKSFLSEMQTVAPRPPLSAVSGLSTASRDL